MELLEFLLRLAEVLLVPVDDPLSLALSPVFREESVQTVWRESFALRYSLSDVLVSGTSAVAAAQLTPIASCGDDSVPVIPPLVSVVLSLWGLLLRLLLWFLEPVRDGLSFLLSCRLADLLNEGVLTPWASMSDCSVTSSNLCAVLVSPCGGVQIPGLGAFHSVLCLPGLFFSNQSCAPYVRLSSGVGERHHVAAPWEGNMLTGQELVQAPEFGSTSLEYPRSFSVTPSSPRELLSVLISSSFRSYFSICFSISSSWCLCHFASLRARRSYFDGPGHLQCRRSFQ